jgi:precorrin isomerase
MPPDNARPEAITRVAGGFVGAAAYRPGLGETAAVLYVTTLGLKGKSTGSPAMVNPM